MARNKEHPLITTTDRDAYDRENQAREAVRRIRWAVIDSRRVSAAEQWQLLLQELAEIY